MSSVVAGEKIPSEFDYRIEVIPPRIADFGPLSPIFREILVTVSQIHRRWNEHKKKYDNQPDWQVCHALHPSRGAPGSPY